MINITKYKILLLGLGLFLLIAPLKSFAQQPINAYFFWGEGCPHCAKEEKFLKTIEQENPNIKIFRFETRHNKENVELLKTIAKELDLDIRGVPFLVIGNKSVSGYYNDETTGLKIKNIINEYADGGCEDVVARIINPGGEDTQCTNSCSEDDLECIHNCGCKADLDVGNQIENNSDKVDLPFLGSVSAKAISLPLLTLIIAGADGFNPCAMWVLLFLISLLLGMKDRKRMWILGSSFIFASGFVYFLFLGAWLNILLYFKYVVWLNYLIGAVAIAGGSYHLYDAYKNREGGCHVTDNEKRKRIFTKLRNIVSQNSFVLALAGIMMLGAVVNLVELLCSAGLPAVYSQVLVMSEIPAWQHYAYLLFYVFIYMLDDLVIFLIAMLTLNMKGINSKYMRYSTVIGAIVILIIGILLIFKPGWIMFA